MPQTLVVDGTDEDLARELGAEDATVHHLHAVIVEAFGGQRPAQVIVKGLRLSVGISASGEWRRVYELSVGASPLQTKSRNL